MTKHNLLIICGTFPPQSDVGGLRPAMVAKYLGEFGWQTFVFTGEYPEGDPRRDLSQEIRGLLPEDRICRAVYGQEHEEQALSKRGLLGTMKAVFMPELAHPPGKVQALERLLPDLWSDIRFDAVLATAPDLHALRLGRGFHRLRGTPWIADFRDLAEQEEGLAKGFRQNFLHFRSKCRRNRLVKTASLITVVSKTHQQILERKLGRAIHVVYNGYDPDQPGLTSAPHKADKFRIVYVGRLLSQWYRDPTVLFAGLDLLRSNQPSIEEKLEVLFYGSEAEILEPILKPFWSKKLVKIIPRAPHSQIPEILSQAAVLTVITNRGRQGVLTTKFFEYLPTRKPILCVPGDGGELDAVLQSTRCGRSCAEPGAVADSVGSWFVRWAQGHPLEVIGDKTMIERFSRRAQTGVMVELINKIVTRSHHAWEVRLPLQVVHD
jgi:glycosyltransferase involved in cell wall biosynthesis